MDKVSSFCETITIGIQKGYKWLRDEKSFIRIKRSIRKLQTFDDHSLSVFKDRMREIFQKICKIITNINVFIWIRIHAMRKELFITKKFVVKPFVSHKTIKFHILKPL